jgi:FMN phosphatase YigB (HAD superfamily)
MATPHDVVTFFDLDNTLLDNDSIAADLHRYLDAEVGPKLSERYWQIFEALRVELGYADYLGALQRFRNETAFDPCVLAMSSFLLDYPFADRLYPGALGAIAHAQKFGPAVLLSDGDVVFQPRKIHRSGVWDALGGRVLVYIHKEVMLADVEHRYPARHYIMVDDKLRILAAMKKVWGERLTTVFPKQGHYALDPEVTSKYPPADLSIDRIGDFTKCDLPALLGAARR